jgi:uncharacterized protein YcbK (DUF882 family)
MQRKSNFWGPVVIGAGVITGIVLLLRKGMKTEKLSKYFDWSEFQSNDGAAMPDHVKANIKKLVPQLEKIRAASGNRPMRINSGYRSPAQNTAVGGVKNSYHMQGMAADFTIQGMTPKQVQQLVGSLIDSGQITQGGLGSYGTFTHYDIRGTKSRWNG